jgi:hypothetical protein
MRASKVRGALNRRARTGANDAMNRSPTLRAERRGRAGSAKVRPLSWVDDPRAKGRRIAKARGGFYAMSADGTGRWIVNWHPNDEPRKPRGRKVSLGFLVPEAAAVQACEQHFLERQTNTGYFADDAELADAALSGPATAWKRR